MRRNTGESSLRCNLIRGSPLLVGQRRGAISKLASYFILEFEAVWPASDAVGEVLGALSLRKYTGRPAAKCDVSCKNY